MQIPDQKLDETILSTAMTRWQKVAMIITRSLDQLEKDGVQLNDDVEASYERLGVWIESLVLAGQPESQGDISLWRFSEVRLPTRGR